ncbi:hypothetical protein AAFC00_002916 [Neodothiora populina]|uniref:Uncharacterized protein n=1 Tax=Neodothiora populina TaxID=2781224 RepID=A0ABR3P8N7_9PEZI
MAPNVRGQSEDVDKSHQHQTHRKSNQPQISGARAIDNDSLRQFLSGATQLYQHYGQLDEALKEITAAIIAIYRRQGDVEGNRPSVTVATLFQTLGKASLALRSRLDDMKPLMLDRQNMALIHIDAGHVGSALAAVNDVYSLLMEGHRSICRFDEIVNKTMDKAEAVAKSKTKVKFDVESELQKLEYPQAVSQWKGAFQQWLDTSKQPMWVLQDRGGGEHLIAQGLSNN